MARVVRAGVATVASFVGCAAGSDPVMGTTGTTAGGTRSSRHPGMIGRRADPGSQRPGFSCPPSEHGSPLGCQAELEAIHRQLRIPKGFVADPGSPRHSPLTRPASCSQRHPGGGLAVGVLDADPGHTRSRQGRCPRTRLARLRADADSERSELADVCGGIPAARSLDSVTGRDAESFGMGPAVMLRQDLADVAGPVCESAVANLAAGDRQMGNDHRYCATRPAGRARHHPGWPPGPGRHPARAARRRSTPARHRAAAARPRRAGRSRSPMPALLADTNCRSAAGLLPGTARRGCASVPSAAAFDNED
jgi:hypothetical protein